MEGQILSLKLAGALIPAQTARVVLTEFDSAGIPHIILPQWGDLYDNAVRVEYLGLGIYGNKTRPPAVGAVEFGAALLRIVGPGPESEGFRQRACKVGELCRAAGGRKTAVDIILREMTKGGHLDIV